MSVRDSRAGNRDWVDALRNSSIRADLAHEDGRTLHDWAGERASLESRNLASGDAG